MTESAFLQQQRIELWLQRTNGHILPIGAFIAAIIMRAAIEQVTLALVAPTLRGMHSIERRREDGCAIHHRRVHHLPLSRLSRCEQSTDDAKGKQQATTAEIAHEVERRHGRLVVTTNGVQHTAQRNVVEVVSRHVRERSRLSPARHTPIHQLGIARQTHIGTESQAFHHTGAQPFDQRISARAEFERNLDIGRLFEVERNGATPAIHHIEACAGGRRQWILCAFAINANHVRAHVCEHHRAKGTRSDAGEFEDGETCEGPHKSSSCE